MLPTCLLFQFSPTHALLTFLPALVNLCIALYVFLYLPRNKTTEVFGFSVFALTFWQLADGLFQGVETHAAAVVVDKIFSFSWVAAAPLCFHFACRYTGARIVQHRLFLLATYGPFFLLHCLYIAYTDENSMVRDPAWGWVVTPSTHGVEACTHWIIAGSMALVAIMNLVYAVRLPKNSPKKTQALLVATGFLIPTVGGICTQVLFPLLFHRNELPLTSVLITFFSLAVITALSRFRLFDAAESLTIDSLLQQVQHLVLLITPDQQVRPLNAFTRDQFGSRPGSDSQPLDTFFENEERYRSFLQQVFEPAMSGQLLHNCTVTFTNGKRALRTVLSAEPVRSGTHVQGVLLVANDLTGYLDLVDELKQSNERYRLISRASNDMVWDWDLRSGRVYRSKEGWQKLFQQGTEDRGSAEEWLQRIHPEDRPIGQDLYRRIAEGTISDAFDIEFRMLQEDGSVLFLRDRGYVMKDETGRATRIVGATQDITEQKRAARQLAEEVARRHHEVTEAVIAAQENERRLIGAELHDNVNQILTSAKLYVGIAEAATNEADRARFLAQTGDIIGKAMQEVRKLSHTLIPPSLSGETLVEALRHLLEGPAPSGFEVDLDVSRFDEESIPAKLKLTIYRIVQEQWSNIIKHASARQVWVSLRNHRGTLQLQVRDDGIGFNPGEQAQGVGLKNISTRAELHGGSVQVQAAPEKGCTLRVEFPLSIAAFAQ